MNARVSNVQCKTQYEWDFNDSFKRSTAVLGEAYYLFSST